MKIFREVRFILKCAFNMRLKWRDLLWRDRMANVVFYNGSVAFVTIQDNGMYRIRVRGKSDWCDLGYMGVERALDEIRRM